MKKIIAAAAGIFLSVFLLAPAIVQAKILSESQNELWSGIPQAFPDVPAGHTNYNAIGMWSEDEVIKGYPDGTFKPDGNINRAELTKMIVAWIAGDADLSSYKNCFPDVKEEWFAPYVCYAKSKDWVGGYPDGTFKPSNPVNRVEAIKIVLNVMVPSSPVDYWPNPTEAEKALPLPADAEKGQWYAGYLAFSIAKQLLDGQHVTGDEKAFYYKPAEPMTRKEVAEMMYRTWLYMGERIQYVELISLYACEKATQPDMTDDEVHTAWVAKLVDMDMTEDDANVLTAKYGEDDVMQAMLEDSVKVCTKQAGADMSKWDFLTNYGR